MDTYIVTFDIGSATGESARSHRAVLAPDRDSAIARAARLLHDVPAPTVYITVVAVDRVDPVTCERLDGPARPTGHRWVTGGDGPTCERCNGLQASMAGRPCPADA